MTDATNIVTITLGRGRTKQQAFSDAAIVNGYQPTITSLTNETLFTSYGTVMAAGGTPQGLLASLNVNGANAQFVNQLIPCNPVIVAYQTSTTTPNPVSAQTFGAGIWASKCDELDREMMLTAAKIRDEKATPTTIS